MENISNLLVPVDFSRSSRRCLDFAFYLAAKKQLKIHILHVVQTGYLKSLYQTAHIKMLEQEAAKHLHGFCSDYTDNPCLGNVVVASGVPCQLTVATADRLDDVLIIQSSHGWSTPEQQLIGSQAEKVVRRSEKPVLTLKSGKIREVFRKVLLATDFSDTARNALDHAVYFAECFDARLHLLHVVNKQIWYDAFLLTGFEFNILEEQVYKQAETSLHQLLNDTETTCTIHITRGSPMDQIRDKADRLGADLIVLGTHGNSNAENVLIGSVAEKIVRHAPCAVLTVPRQI
jgi:nucleotide-binding universal stress UspA family protein